MSDPKLPPEVEVDLFRAFLRQVNAVYDNPELKRTIGNALRGEWDLAFYEKYRPEKPKK